MPTTSREELSPLDQPTYDLGYREATININELLTEIILRNDTADSTLIEITGFILGNNIIFGGGSAQDAIDVAQGLNTVFAALTSEG